LSAVNANWVVEVGHESPLGIYGNERRRRIARLL
jgi:hypothetical protein